MRTHRRLFLGLCGLLGCLQAATAAVDVREDAEPELTLEPVTENAPTLTLTPAAPEWTPLVLPTVEASETPLPPPTSLNVPPSVLTTVAAPDTLFALPARAAVDDGLTDWEYTAAWSLQPRDTGQIWHLLGRGTREVLHWTAWIDLRAAAVPAALSFETQLSGDGSAAIEVSVDDVNWQLLAVVPVARESTMMTFDLSAFRGRLLQFRFSWQPADASTSVDWWLDHIQVAEVPPTLPIVAVAVPTETADNPEPTPDQVTNGATTEPERPFVAALPCRLDVDTDGVITEADFALIAGEVFDRADIQIEAYDLNGNRQIDIGDLQMMAQYGSTRCPE
jgi:hypothetical protein